MQHPENRDSELRKRKCEPQTHLSMTWKRFEILNEKQKCQNHHVMSQNSELCLCLLSSHQHSEETKGKHIEWLEIEFILHTYLLSLRKLSFTQNQNYWKYEFYSILGLFGVYEVADRYLIFLCYPGATLFKSRSLPCWYWKYGISWSHMFFQILYQSTGQCG